MPEEGDGNRNVAGSARDLDDLDMALIAELNEEFGEEEFEEETGSGVDRRTLSAGWKLTAALVVAGFVTVFLLGSWLHLITWSSLGFLGKSRELSGDPMVRQLQEVVVLVEVLVRDKTGFMARQRRGTGFNIQPEGVIVTNRHVVQDAVSATVSFSRHGNYPVPDWVEHPVADLAVLFLRRENLPFITREETEITPSVEEKVIIIGNPQDFGQVVMEGSVSGYWQEPGLTGPVMEIEAPIQPGNSGSPVFDRQGRLVGIVFAALKGEADGGGRGLALPVTLLDDLL